MVALQLLGNSVPAGRVAAFFAESIQGAGGVVQFPKGYLKKAQELIKKNGGLYVADEVRVHNKLTHRCKAKAYQPTSIFLIKTVYFFYFVLYIISVISLICHFMKTQFKIR